MTGLRCKAAFGALAMFALAACDENGGISLPASFQSDDANAAVAINAPNQVMTDRDIERPDIFSVNDRGLWDGRPSLGGSWVAHPDVDEPERAVIRNLVNGREITGALFRRERENPGPLLQVSSDAAEALGMLPGAPTDLEVVVLRREETAEEVPEFAENPVVGSLEAPVTVVAEPLEPDTSVAGVPSAGGASVALPAALEAATAAVAEGTAAGALSVSTETTGAAADSAVDALDVTSVLSPVVLGTGPLIAQVGVYSVQANADAAAMQIIQAGIAANVNPIDSGGRTVWQVTAGPLADQSGIARLKALGFLDAVIIPQADR